MHVIMPSGRALRQDEIGTDWGQSLQTYCPLSPPQSEQHASCHRDTTLTGFRGLTASDCV